MSKRRHKPLVAARSGAPAAAMPRRTSKQDAEIRDQMLLDAAFAYQSGQFAEAEAKGRTLLERFPKFPPALLMLGMIAAKTARTSLADEVLREVIRLDPQSVEARTELAAVLNASGQSAEAAELCEEAIRLRPDDAGIYNVLGLSLIGTGRLPEAMATFRRAIALKPDFGLLHLNFGIALQGQGRDLEAMAAYRQALSLSPQLAEAHTRLGHLLLAHGQKEAGLDSLRRAAAAQPDTTFGRNQNAELDLIDGRLAEAEAELRHAITLDPNSTTYHLLGILQQQTGRFDAAIASYEQVIALRPHATNAYLGIVGIKKLTEADRPLLERMQSLLDDRSIVDEERRSLHYALGKALDDLGDYEGAMQHFDAANRIIGIRLQHAGMIFDRERFRADIDQLIAGFTAEFFAHAAGFGVDSDLPVFIVGMPRSGTTLVEQIVSNHPHIAASGEQSFWSDRINLLMEGFAAGLDVAAANRFAEEYCSTLRIAALRHASGTSTPPRFVTDKMPVNFLMLGFIHLMLPQARIIHCRRNPVDTCLSIYFTPFGNLLSFAHDRGDLVAYYEQYARLMDHWRSVLPVDRFLEIDYETLVATPEPVTQQLIEFCGLDWDPSCLEHQNNRHIITTPSAWQARQPVYRSSVERWRRYEPWLGALADLVVSPSGHR
jgi:tetratricopeptide (TPR) repeat protein